MVSKESRKVVLYFAYHCRTGCSCESRGGIDLSKAIAVRGMAGVNVSELSAERCDYQEFVGMYMSSREWKSKEVLMRRGDVHRGLHKSCTSAAFSCMDGCVEKGVCAS